MDDDGSVGLIRNFAQQCAKVTDNLYECNSTCADKTAVVSH